MFIKFTKTIQENGEKILRKQSLEKRQKHLNVDVAGIEFML